MENYKEKLIEVIEEFQRRELPEVKEREIKLDLETDLINDVIGIRRAGKTYLMFLTIKKLGKERTIYVNFENRKLFPLTPAYFNALVEIIYARDLLKKFKRVYLFLDEIQRIDGWEKYVRSIYDEFKGKIKIFISGSTSKLTKSKLSYLLSGRHLTTVVFPLSFTEFLKFKDFRVPKFLVEEDRSKLMKYLKEYIEFGGFPEIVLSSKKEEMIETLMLDIISRDVLPRIVKKRDVVEDLAYFFCSNSGKLISFNKVSRILKGKGVSLSVPSVEKFFNIMKDVFLFFDLPVYSYKVGKQLLYPKKVYCIDTGFINFFGFKFSEDRGRLIENLVALELKRRGSRSPRSKIFYWKDYQQREVDFVVKEGLKVKQLIQVTYASSLDEIEKSELRSLVKASELLKCKDLLIITWDLEGMDKHGNRRIELIPLWKWLLG